MRRQSMSPGRGRRRPVGPRQGAGDRRPRSFLEAIPQFVEHRRHDLTSRFARLVGQKMVELDERGDERDVGLDSSQHLRFEQELTQIEPFDGVALQHLYDGRGEIPTDVAEPAGHAGRGSAEPARTGTGAASRLRTGRRVVQGAEGAVDPDVVAVQLDRHAVALSTAEDEPPAPQPLAPGHLLSHRRPPGRGRASSR